MMTRPFVKSSVKQTVPFIFGPGNTAMAFTTEDIYIIIMLITIR